MGNSTNKLNKELIETHTNTTAKHKKKLLLLGMNAGKSHWFNNSEKDHKPLTSIKFKTAAFNIGDKLPDIECIIYDTPQDEHFFSMGSIGLKYIGIANGIILTYCTHNFDALNHLEKCMDLLDENMNFKTAVLLLGMTETRKNNTENNFYYTELIIERANQLASKYRLMHMQVDISINIKTSTPYICILRKIMKQKQDPMSPVVEFDITFDESKQDITDSPFVLGSTLNNKNNGYPDIDLIDNDNNNNITPHPPPAWQLPKPNSKELAIYQSTVYGNNKLLLQFPNGAQNVQNVQTFQNFSNIPNAQSISNAKSAPNIHNIQNAPNVQKFPKINKIEKHFSLDSLNAYETDDHEKKLQCEPNNNINEEKQTQSESQFAKMVKLDDDTVCKMEFQRFFEESLGKNRSNKYIGMFKKNQYDDIRLIDPDIFDADFFKSDDIKMNILDQKLFQKEIKKYNNDKIKFENILDSVNMKEKYRKTFENRGIATLWSFHYYISTVKHIKKIIKNKKDSKIIWNELCVNNDSNNNLNQTAAVVDNEGNFGNNNNDKGSSDSEDMYNGNSGNDDKFRKNTVPTKAFSTSYAEGGL